MNFLTNKSFTKKFIISIISIILLSFCVTPNVRAEVDIKGTMLGYVADFATGLADIGASLIQLGLTGEWSYAVDEEGTGDPQDDGSEELQDYWVNKKDFQYPILRISPELIFANKIQMLDANFVSPLKDASEYEIKMQDSSVLGALRGIIASWYVILRNIAAVGMLSILIYIGIRIMISSTSAEKAKYKQRILDWVIAFCLLFFMHYIMAATVTVVEKVNVMLAGNAGLAPNDDKYEGLEIPEEYPGVIYDPAGMDEGEIAQNTLQNAQDWFDENYPDKEVTITRNNDSIGAYDYYYEINIDGKGDIKLAYSPTSGWEIPDWAAGDLTEEEKESLREYLTRPAQPTGGEGSTGGSSYIDSRHIKYFTNYARLFINSKDKFVTRRISFLIVYVALVTFTVVFTFRYIKRVIYIAFLTLMAPLVALTYPIDKIKDRQSASLEYVV